MKLINYVLVARYEQTMFSPLTVRAVISHTAAASAAALCPVSVASAAAIPDGSEAKKGDGEDRAAEADAYEDA